MIELTEGSLVSWQDGADEHLGVVSALTAEQVTVQFDGFEDVRIFKRSADVVRRIVLGGSIRRVSTGEIGTIQAQESIDPPRWQALFGDTVTTVQERDLRPHVLLDPASRLRGGTIGGPGQVWLTLVAHWYRLDAMNRDLISLSESRVALKPHQIAVVHRVVTSYPHRFLLCDEVGLGKTIEAGVILKELRARKSADRVLIIVPPNLMRQWQFELKTKFNEAIPIINRDTVRHLRTQHGQDANPFELYDSAIVSSAWITGTEWQRLATEADWDLVIVDEAHHARIQYRGSKIERTQLYRVVEQLASPERFSKRSVLFLTATPMQLDVGEIFGLVELLDPALFPTLQHFRDHKDQVPRLNKLVQDLKIQGLDAASDPLVLLESVAALLKEDPHALGAELRSGTAGVDAVCERLSDRHLLSQILIRNRKKVVGGFMPRQAYRWEVTLTDEERRALNAVEDYVRNGYQQAARQNNAAVGFVMVIFQKLMASSTQALRVSLSRRVDRLLSHSAKAIGASRLDELEQADEAGEIEMDDVLTLLGDATRAEAAELDHLVELLDSLPRDSKAETLLEKLRELENEEPNPKVLLFTEFRQTQGYLRERLASELGWDVQVFHGGLKPLEKDDAVDAFRSASGPSILLSTEAGGEGRNFQFCHLLVNYDLPWNPMRVEQRIGRVDRLGQEHPVHVFNFWISGTIEGRVLNVLENRVGIFEDTVGGLDPILGDTETDLKKIFQLGEAERDHALAKYEADVERRVSEARDAEERLRDFIMETRSFSKELVKQVEAGSKSVAPQQLEPFAIALLKDVNTWLGEEPDGSYRLHFHEPFISDFPRHTHEQGVKRAVTFRPDVAADSEHVEYMTLGHSVIDDLVDRVTAQRYAGCAGGVVVLSDQDETLSPAHGWLVAHQLSVPGIRSVRELEVVFIHDSGETDADLALTLLGRASAMPEDDGLDPTAIAKAAESSLGPALSEASNLAWSRLGTLESELAQAAESRLAQELAKLHTYFEYREKAAADKLAASQATLSRLEASEDPDQRRIIPLWSNNVLRDQALGERLGHERLERLAGLQRQTNAAGDVTLLSVVRVEIRESVEVE
jgi:ATP-dependent helicase HepA